MSDLDQLRNLGEQVRPPSFDTLVATAKRRNRRTAALGVACAVVIVMAGGAVLNTGDNDRTAPPVAPPDGSGEVWGPAEVPLFEVGQTHTSSRGLIETTVLDLADPFESGGGFVSGLTSPPAPRVWVGLELETCIVGHATTASAEDWELVDAKGTHLTAEYARQDVLPRHPYPAFGTAVSHDECVRGWALWAVPTTFTPVTALKVYHGDGRNRPGRRLPVAAWNLVETP